jgi:hypothetical protein
MLETLKTATFCASAKDIHSCISTLIRVIASVVLLSDGMKTATRITRFCTSVIAYGQLAVPRGKHNLNSLSLPIDI